jgi:diguanylate cyclase (GGDEF)-like protein/PAS domain S-box-containing protein
LNFAHAFRSSPSIVVLLRLEDARVVDVNARFEAATGFSRKEAVGKSPRELGLWDEPEAQREIFERLLANRSISNEPFWFRDRDGKPFAGLLTAEIVDAPGGELVFGLIQDIGAYNAREQAVRAAEEKYRSIFENAIEGIYRSTPDGRFVAVNPALAALLGFESPADLMANIDSIQTEVYVDPSERPRLLRILEEVGEFRNVEFRLRRRNGEIIWVTENARATRDQSGQTLYYEGTLVDITPRKQAEQAMLQSEEKYRALVEHSQDGVFITQHMRYVYVNHTYAEMLGYTPEELTGMEWIRVIAPEDRQMLLDLWDQRMRGKWESHAYEVRLLKKDGETRIIASVRAGPVTYNGELASTGTVRDITAERRHEAALAEAEDRYRELFENAVLGMYQTAPDGRFITANQAMADIFGFASAPQMIAEVKTIRDHYADPSQREVLLADLHRTGQVRGLEYRIRRRDGSIAWVSQNARVVRSPDGAVRCYEGVVQDITARRMAESALHKSEEKYRALVETSQIGVFINREGRYVYVNKAFAEMVGYTEIELTGRSYRDVIAPEDLSAADDRYNRRQRGEQTPDHYEVRLLHKDGQTRVVTTMSATVVDQDSVKLIMGTVRDVTEQKRVERQLRHNATHDPLTGLPNRTFFIERLQKAIQYAKRRGEASYAVLFLDLDGFKVVNDSLGHAAGDQLLVEAAHRIKKCLRPWDTMSRHGGDEFTVLIDHMRGVEDAVDIAERIHKELEQPVQLGDHEVFINASIGIALGADFYQSTDEVLRDADTAMYKAKATGKAGYAIFDTRMHEVAKQRLRIETELRQALEREEFRAFYQPVVDLSSRKLMGFEALVRWQHPSRGLLRPGEFLAVAEDTGLILPIGWWMLREAATQLAAWQRKYPKSKHLSVAVNVSNSQFAHAELPQRVVAVLEQTGLPAASLHLEITESVFMENPRLAIERMRELRSLGVHLHLDDFGTGYSSLSYLSQLPLDVLKVDRSFVMDIVENKAHHSIAKTIVQLAKDLGISTIAEGIENADQAKALKKLGCPLAQGNLFATPLAAEAAEPLIEMRTIQLG